MQNKIIVSLRVWVCVCACVSTFPLSQRENFWGYLFTTTPSIWMLPSRYIWPTKYFMFLLGDHGNVSFPFHFSPLISFWISFILFFSLLYFSLLVYSKGFSFHLPLCLFLNATKNIRSPFVRKILDNNWIAFWFFCIVFFVLTDPPEIIKKPQNLGVRVGGVATFYCAARGDPPPTIVWRKNGKKVSGEERN